MMVMCKQIRDNVVAASYHSGGYFAHNTSSGKYVLFLIVLAVALLLPGSSCGVVITVSAAEEEETPIIDPSLLKRAVQAAERVIATSETPLSSAAAAYVKEAAFSGSNNPKAIYMTAKILDRNPDTTELAVEVFHSLADHGSLQHVPSQVALGFAYYNNKDGATGKARNYMSKAIHYFTTAGLNGPHQAALYNAGRCYSELQDWESAVIYIRACATLQETHPAECTDKLTVTCQEALEIALTKQRAHAGKDEL